MDIYDVANRMKLERKTIYDLNINVTFYARVSTTREEQENSIENQIAYFTQLINDNPNWTYIEGYVDRIRGESAENRNEFMRMIQDGKDGKFDLVLTKEVSRFARNTIDSLTYTRELLRSGVGVFFQNDNICTIDTDSELRLTIMSSIAADEVRKLSERVKWGHKRSIESGNVLGNSRIFGYDKKDCRLIINQSEAEMVKMIFELYATGDYSVRKIESILYDKGYRGRNGTRIYHNTISGIIQNPKYKGYYCGNKVKITDYRTREQKFLPEKDWVMYRDETGEIVPAIVSEDIWNKCNEIFKQRSTATKDHSHSYKPSSILSGKIWCASHNKPYWRTSYSSPSSKGEQIYQWICSEKKQYGAKACSSFAMLETEIYNMLGSFFVQINDNLNDYIDTFMRIYNETDMGANTKKQIEKLNQQLSREKQKYDKLLELYMDDIISKDDFAKRSQMSNSAISDIEDEIDLLNKQNQNNKERFAAVNRMKDYLENMYNSESVITKENVDALVDAIVERIDVLPVNDTEMKLGIKLKSGGEDELIYIRKGSRYGRYSGNITKKISPEHRMSFVRINRRKTGHMQEMVYRVYLTI